MITANYRQYLSVVSYRYALVFSVIEQVQQLLARASVMKESKTMTAVQLL